MRVPQRHATRQRVAATYLVEASLVLIESYGRMHAIQTEFAALEALLAHTAHDTCKIIRRTSDSKHNILTIYMHLNNGKWVWAIL